jgi:ATP-dependent helicase/nuclease subunit A
VPVWSPRKDADVPETELERAVANAKAEEEFRRLLYVALTRAQDRLILAGHWHGARPPGYHDRSWYALCETAMNRLAVEPDEDGIRRFGDLPPRLVAAASGSAELAGLPDWVFRVPNEPANRRRFGAPSSLLDRKTPVLAPFSEVRQKRLRRGRIIHALLEYLPALPLNAREDAADRYLSRLPDLEDPDRQEMKAAVFGILDAPDMQRLFQAGGRAEAAIVGSAPELPDGLIVNGRVDRLVVTQNEVLIVDFKTDQPAPDRPEEVADTYRAQMAAYWAVLRRAYPGRSVRTALCWTDGPRLMFLPEDMLLEALKGAQRVV